MALAGDISSALHEGNVLLRAEPGAGKSTALPLALLLNSNLNSSILLLEPRRLAARSVAARLASHLNEKVGERIGLRMRSETRISNHTQLTVVTEGVLTRLLQADPTLENIGLVIFDEFHERSLHADLGAALCIEIQQALRDDLRLMFMSATMETDELKVSIPDIKQFDCSVRQHPVHIEWLGEQKNTMEQQVVKAVLTATKNQEGDTLVFLPGVAEIKRCSRLLRTQLASGFIVCNLHRGISIDDQKRATAPANTEYRRVILATSLAETSITIEGVKVVIDTGLERRGRIDTSSGATRLETVTASQASATQRAGRAGRTSAGICYRLWSESGHSRRAAQWQPEIFRSDLTPLMMELGLWGTTDIAALPWLSQPPTANIARATDLLKRLTLWKDNQLTPRGRLAGSLPVHPRLGHMLLWASDHGVSEIACKLAVVVEENNAQFSNVNLELSLNTIFPKDLMKRSSQLAKLIANKELSSLEKPSSGVIIAQAFPDWIAKKRPGAPGRYQLACGTGVEISAEDHLAQSAWLSVAQLGGSGSQLKVFKAAELNIDELEHYSPQHFETIKHLDWDDKQEKVIGESRKMLGKLIVDSKPLQQIHDSDKAEALLSGIRKKGVACLPWTEDCREWQARVKLISNLSTPTMENEWPLVDDASLTEQLGSWLLPWLNGVGSMKRLQQINLYQSLTSLLNYQQQSLLDNWLPKRFTVPSGSRIKLNYLDSDTPTLSVKLQEMLGCSNNPSIANGQIFLKVELLSPAYRQVQVTTDLANFWTNSYPEVKKEMAGRYPKHFWPDDPLAASPRSNSIKRN